VVKLLLNKGAGTNAQGGFYSNALHVVPARGYTKVMTLLLDKKANFNTQGGHYGNALQAALDAVI
jgi:hypothetical protein